MISVRRFQCSEALIGCACLRGTSVMSAARDNLDLFSPTPEERCVYTYLKDGSQLAYDGAGGELEDRLYETKKTPSDSVVVLLFC